jgi:uncharacterized protein (UPF0179 family)
MPTYRCPAIEKRVVTVEVEATSIEEARDLFKAGEGEIVDEHMAETDDLRCELDDIEIVNS